jgi:RNA polymerase sigma-70 factor (ECF subfamily)
MAGAGFCLAGRAFHKEGSAAGVNPKGISVDGRREFGQALIGQLPALRRYARALVGNTAHADDLVQDCIERALRQKDRLREPQRLGGWLRSILHNLYIDELRRARSRGPERDIDDYSDDYAVSTPPADRGTAIDLTRAMDTLTLEHRQVLLLVGLENLNYREIAAELKIPIGTVMSRLARARERLRSALEGDMHRSATVLPLDVRKAQR